VFGLVAQLAISVIACPLKGTGLGETVTCTAPVPVPVEGLGEGVGAGDGVGVGVPPLLPERDGTPPVVTGDGEVGSVEPQLIATNAAKHRSATRTQARMFLRNTRGPCREGPLTQDAHLFLHSAGPCVRFSLTRAIRCSGNGRTVPKCLRGRQAATWRNACYRRQQCGLPWLC